MRALLLPKSRYHSACYGVEVYKCLVFLSSSSELLKTQVRYRWCISTVSARVPPCLSAGLRSRHNRRKLRAVAVSRVCRVRGPVRCVLISLIWNNACWHEIWEDSSYAGQHCPSNLTSWYSKRCGDRCVERELSIMSMRTRWKEFRYMVEWQERVDESKWESKWSSNDIIIKQS